MLAVVLADVAHRGLGGHESALDQRLVPLREVAGRDEAQDVRRQSGTPGQGRVAQQERPGLSAGVRVEERRAGQVPAGGELRHRERCGVLREGHTECYVRARLPRAALTVSPEEFVDDAGRLAPWALTGCVRIARVVAVRVAAATAAEAKPSPLRFRQTQ